MMAYLIKSILTLGILYIFYWLFLRNLKTFSFNRFFILSSLVFSLIIPLVTIPVEVPVVSIIPAESSLQIENTIQFSGEFIANTSKLEPALFTFLPLFYVGLSLILLIRFSINLLRIFQTIRTNQSIDQSGYQLILVEKQILPHSFFNYIFINQAQYLTGEIDSALIEHESTHCRQWHSIDIIMVELLKVVFWINPFIWLIRKQMQLNHEFLADQSVLTKNDITQYRHLLLNTILKNQTGILVSSFNFSFTKQRLKMMTRKFYPKRAIILRIFSLITFFTLVFFISCEQNLLEEIDPNLIESENEWWQPILKKHGIEPRGYNNFPFVFEMGSKNSINNGTVELENALFIFQPVIWETKEIDQEQYILLNAPYAVHHLDQGCITARDGELRFYNYNSNEHDNTEFLSFSDLEIEVNEKKFFVKMTDVNRYVEFSDGSIKQQGDHIYGLSIRM